MQALTIGDLRKKRINALRMSEKAIREHVAAYHEIKTMVREINTGPLDIALYYQTASRLGMLLTRLAYRGTIFQYFAEQIDPRKNGDVRYFRAQCLDLNEQLKELDRWRTKKHHLRRVK
jgi:hypothetical protein